MTSVGAIMPARALRPWDTAFAACSPMYAPLSTWAKRFESYPQWPSLEDYQRVLQQPATVLTATGQPLRIVPQDGKPNCFEAHYAPRIYLTGELQTRRENWHDFFQFLTWRLFPATKAAINALHYPAARQRLSGAAMSGRRAPLENMLSLFDEGGAVVYSSDAGLLQSIREFRWKELFWRRRAELADKLGVVVFGHALYEKGLAPYIGMTANCILLQVDAAFMRAGREAQVGALDERLAQLFAAGVALQAPKDLSPLPILGLPGWDAGNTRETYYENFAYFRAGHERGAVHSLSA